MVKILMLYALGNIIGRLGIFLGGLGLLASLAPLSRGEYDNFLFGVCASIGVALLFLGLRWVLRGKTITL